MFTKDDKIQNKAAIEKMFECIAGVVGGLLCCYQGVKQGVADTVWWKTQHVAILQLELDELKIKEEIRRLKRDDVDVDDWRAIV